MALSVRKTENQKNTSPERDKFIIMGRVLQDDKASTGEDRRIIQTLIWTGEKPHCCTSSKLPIRHDHEAVSITPRLLPDGSTEWEGTSGISVGSPRFFVGHVFAFSYHHKTNTVQPMPP